MASKKKNTLSDFFADIDEETKEKIAKKNSETIAKLAKQGITASSVRNTSQDFKKKGEGVPLCQGHPTFISGLRYEDY